MQKSIMQTSRLAPYKTFFYQKKKPGYLQILLYALLIWKFASKSSINKICKIHIRTLQIVHNVHDKSYEELLAVSNDITLYQKHLRILAIEVYKFLMKTNSDFTWNLYTIKPIPYDLRTGDKLYLPTVNTARYGLISLIFRGSLLWNNFY